MKRKGRVTTTVVKLDSLPDPVWAGTENHDLASIGWRGFVFTLVSRVKIRCVRFKLSAARVDAFVNRNDSQTLAILTHFVFRTLREIRKTSIGERHFFKRSQLVAGNVWELRAFDALLNVRHLLQLIEKPRIDARETIDFRDGPVVLECVSDVGEALRIRPCQFALQLVVGNVLES